MKKDFETKLTGWIFIIAAILLWGGWALLPHKVGEYFQASDFDKIGENVWLWIWMFRIYIFGWVGMIIALLAFITISSKSPYRILIVPGAGMIIIGTFTLAIASAYYYNYGSWGVGQTMGKTTAQVQEFMDNVLYVNQYVTCFVRFGRIFSGVGLILLGAGFVKWNIVQKWLGWFTILLGLSAVGIILAIPEYYEIYKPIFHIKSIWILVMGIIILYYGINLPHLSKFSEK